MKRRDFLTKGSTALAISAGLTPGLAHAFVGTDYKTGLVQKHLKAGDTVFLDFFTHWCSTCASQGRTIEALLGDNPAYQENITFIRVDWDRFSDSKLARDLRIPRRSTLVALKGDAELGRIVAGTRTKDIKALLDSALNAATA